MNASRPASNGHNALRSSKEINMRTTRILLALAAFALSLQWSKPAFADVTITGTVGEVAAIGKATLFCGSVSIVRFKLTDQNQTTTCTDQGVAGTTAKYSYFVVQGGCIADALAKEWYAMLLYSKKGAPITCTIVSGTDCRVTSCTLP